MMLMKLITVIALLLMGWVSNILTEKDVPGLILPQANNVFGAYLYQAVKNEPGNIALSPLSVTTLLAITWLGADGYSAHELITALRLKDNRSEVEESFKDFLSLLEISEPGVVLNLADMVFIQQSFPVKSAFEQAFVKYFHSGVQHVDFQDNKEAAALAINQWVKKATRNKIRDLITKDSLDSDTKLILTNAIYFKADWLKPFTDTENIVEPFFLPGGSHVEVPMMHQTSQFRVKTFKKFGQLKVLRLPYKREDLSMLILLPKHSNGLECLEARLPLMNITDMVRQLKKRSVEVTIPKFKIEKELKLKEALIKMGVLEIFSRKANLSGITDIPLHVEEMVQKTFLEISEEGTEAAVATQMEFSNRMGTFSLPFKANHPFLFLIYDERSEIILFIGRLVRPDVIAG